MLIPAAGRRYETTSRNDYDQNYDKIFIPACDALSSIRAQIPCAEYPRLKTLSLNEKEPLIRQAGSRYEKQTNMITTQISINSSLPVYIYDSKTN
jgi:hypothetical protein